MMRRFFDFALRIGFIGMIATGNHGHLESLRYAQNDKPLVRQKHLKKATKKRPEGREIK